MTGKFWYALQRSTEDAWDTGTDDKETARKMLEAEQVNYPNALITVIEKIYDDDCLIDEICVAEVHDAASL